MSRQAHQQFMDAKADVVYHEYPIQHTISEESLNAAAAWMQQKI